MRRSASTRATTGDQRRDARLLTRAVAHFLGLGLAVFGGCTGEIGSIGTTGSAASGSGLGSGAGGSGVGGRGTGSAGSGAVTGTGVGGATGTGASGSGGAATGNGGRAGSVVADPNAAGLLPLRRLTSREYLNTVRDLLADTTSVAADDVPGEADDISNNAFPFRQPTSISTVDSTNLELAAEALAKGLATRLSTILPCTPANASAEAGCASQFITTFGLKAFRRPLSTVEVSDLNALYQTARTTLMLDFNGAIGVLVEAMLQSPGFLYHWEMDPGPALRDGAVVQLGNYQVASRLSYYLWGSMPDAALFAAAAAGQLATADGVQTQAQRMLMDSKAQNMVADFVDDWLDVEHDRSAAQGSGGLQHVEPGPRHGDGHGGPQLRHIGDSRLRVVRGSFHQYEIVGQPGAGGDLRRHGRHRHHAESGDPRCHPARRDPDAGGLPGRQRRHRRIVAYSSRPRGADASAVPEGPRPARQRPASETAHAGADDPTALRRARHAGVHGRLSCRDGSDRVRLRTLRRHRALPDDGPEPTRQFERLGRCSTGRRMHSRTRSLSASCSRRARKRKAACPHR